MHILDILRRSTYYKLNIFNQINNYIQCDKHLIYLNITKNVNILYISFLYYLFYLHVFILYSIHPFLSFFISFSIIKHFK